MSPLPSVRQSETSTPVAVHKFKENKKPKHEVNTEDMELVS